MEDLKHTCKVTCKFWKKYKHDCPFYLETVWRPPADATNGTPVVIKDCAPKRSVLLQMASNNALLGLQQANEEYRNRQEDTGKGLAALLRTVIDNPMIPYDSEAEVLKIENLDQ
jgi:hypothetical protein